MGKRLDLKRVFAMLWLLLAALLAQPALAQPTNIKAELIAEGPAAPGETVTLAFHMRPDPTWHGYWSNPGDAGFGMTLTWELPPGASAGALQYPVPETLIVAGLMNHVYEHAYALLVPLTLPKDAKPGAMVPIRVAADWLACTDKVCVPEKAVLATTVTVAAPGTATRPDPRFDRWRAAMPAPLGAAVSFALSPKTIRLAIPLPASVALEQPHLFATEDRVVDYPAAQAFARKGDLLLVEIPRNKTLPRSPETFPALLRLNAAGDGVSFVAVPGAVPTGGEPLATSGPSAIASLPLLLAGALLGGLLLNIMPCVFPILSLKAISLARAGESEAEARRDGLAYTAGVVLACVALGALLLILRAGGSEIGWAFQLQEPGVVVALLLLAAAITANFLGLFEFAVPGFVGEANPRGAFATGLLAAFVATPCTGPFMAAALGAALLLPVTAALALFAALGLGIALPFLAVAHVPALRRRLPRPGSWMNTFRRWMALPMGLTALALLWLASRLGGMSFAIACAVLTAAVIGLLALVGQRQRGGRAATAAVLACGLFLTVAAVLILPRTIETEVVASDSLLASRQFSAAALAEARASGKPVFVWMTADWCLTCKVNERVAIEREATRAAFGRADVIVLRGDWTRRDPEITRYLTEQGAAGVPLYVWYAADGGAPTTLPQVLTPDTLVGLTA